MRRAAIVAWVLALTLLGVAAGHAEKRVALVVGNGAYQHADKLANPVNDARQMKEKLAKLGFDVIYGEDVDKRALERAVARFADAAQNAAVALVYYAGHGATFNDVPYVVPVDAAFQSLAAMPYELVPVETLIGELRRAKGVRIAVLDACRDNSAERELKRTASRGGEITRGLARVKDPDGLILAYATQYMATAADGPANGHSPFTAALLDNIDTPGLDVKDLFFRVGGAVIAKTGGAQRPEIAVSFYEPFALVPAGPASQGPVATTPTDLAERTWAAIATTTNPAILEDFIRQFGATPYGLMARARLDELKHSQAAAVAPSSPPSSSAPAGSGFLGGLTGWLTGPDKPPAVPSSPAAAPVGEQISIPEGLTSEQIVQRLLGNDILTGNIREIPREGSLLPDTYVFPHGTPREQAIKHMQETQRRLVQEIWEHRSPDLPLKAPEQLVTLASIVEKETSKPEEQPRIAAVLVNRLNVRMKLQADSTIVYGLVGGKGTLGRPIQKAEISQATPYNTFVIDGLPPGPIANPGRAALEAVATPARTSDLYFVGDGRGGHLFAENFEQHAKNVASLRGAAAQPGSGWAERIKNGRP